MKKNIGPLDRLLRLLIAIILLGYAYYNRSLTGYLAGLFVLFEACASWCLFYQLMGRSSCPRK